MNTSNSDSFIGTLNIPCINVQPESSFNTLINLQKETHTESIISINYEILDGNNISEEISYHHHSEEVIDHTCDDNGKNLLNTEEEADVTSIHYVNTTNDTSMNDYDNFIHKYYASFLSSKNNEDVSSGSESNSAKRTVCCHKNIIFYFLINRSKSFE